MSTAYSSVVSVPTRETRSPVRRASNSLIGRCRIRADQLAAARSTPRPCRCAAAGSAGSRTMTDATTTSATSGPDERCRAARRPARGSMTWPTSSGWARVAAAPRMLRTTTTPSTRLVLEEEWQQLLQARARTLVRCATTTASAGGCGCARHAGSLPVGAGERARALSTTVLLVHRLPAHAEGAGDRDPGVPLGPGPAHLLGLGAGEVGVQGLQPAQLGQRLTALCGADGRADGVAHAVNRS